MKLQLIRWADHYSDDDGAWKSLEEERKKPVFPMVCQSVGWVLREDKDTVTLVANLDGRPSKTADLHGYGLTHVLKATIVRRVTLRES